MMQMLNNTCPNNSQNAFERHDGDLAFYNKFTVKHIVEQITVPILVIVGFPGTIISFIIWTRKQMRYSSSIYLSFLAISDCLFYLCHIMWHLNSTYNIPVINNPVMCNVFPTVNVFIQYMSPIFTLAFTVERYISICWPFSRDKYCSINRAMKVSIYLVIANFIMATPMLYFFRYISENNNGCMAIYEVFNLTVPVKESSYWITMFSYNLISELLMFGCIPFIILIINIRVILEMWRIYKSSQIRSLSVENHHRGATTVTLLCVSFYLICACLPLTITHLYGFIINQGDLCLSDVEIQKDKTWRKMFTLVNIQVFVEFFSLTYYGAKFYIYIGTSNTFRTAFIQLIHVFQVDEPEYSISRSERKIRNHHHNNHAKGPTKDTEYINLINVS